MPPIVVIGADVLVAVCLVLLTRGAAPERGPRTLLLPALPLVAVALLLAFVLGEDSYRGNGISRWAAYRSPGGASAPLFVATVALLSLAAASLALAVAQRRRRLLRASALGAAAVAVLLGIPTVVAFAVN